MGQILHRSATTTEAIRRAIQHSQESLRTLARRHGINPKTVAKWRRRSSTADHRTGPTVPKSTVLSIEQEAVIVAFRKHTLLPLDDCLYALQATIPQLTRSSLHRCLERHGISRLPEVEGDKPRKKMFDIYPIGFFHIDLAEVRTAEGKLYLLVAIDRTSKFAVVELVEKADMQAAAAFLEALVGAVPYRIRQRNPVRRSAEEPWRAYGKMAWTSLRSHLSSSWHRPPSDPTQPSLDQRTGRTDEPDHQGSHRQTLLL
jgi:transposase-like protein